MIKRNYHWNNVSEKLLRKNEFKYSNGFSTEDDKAYIKYIPLYRYNDYILLETRIVAYLDGTVKVDVMDSSFHSYYAAWYIEETEERFTFLKDVNKKLKKILDDLGIEETDGDKDKDKKND